MTWIMGLISRWWLPLSLAFGMLGGLAYTLARDTVYAADAYVMVAGGDPARAAHFASAYARIAGHPGLITSGEAEQDALSVAATPDAPMLRLTFMAPEATEAAERVNRAAAALVHYANSHAAQTDVRLVPFATATPPLHPASPVLLICVAIGGCGAVLVAGLVRLAAPPARQAAPRAPEPALTGANA
ncbi:hypothetical protein [Nonomuraea jiangxiensis]|uniref:Capsular polysaccharide biosynthesis protein n=1 Tax=Nonomuraea jiangxiensis TaxID=633440 RepID=A0A1G9P7K8_9ACTN|nr:hypothetical protein [Nonomuraea jiangxiensis]SDL94730.1 hypothetical protein SAMN05421869_13359 [Nonomuraea jiangxiensis]